MFDIQGYLVQKEIFQGTNSLVCRAMRLSDNQTVIVKYLRENYATSVELSRYRQEYDMLSALSQVDGVIRVLELDKHQNIPYLILEDFGGESLKQLFTNQALSIVEFLPLAIQMAHVLGEVHAANIIHKDLNPSNFLLNPQTRQLKLIDFGIATRLPRENPTLKNPNNLEGTLLYLSPEQTGRMNRRIDYRTDLYSLGVSFYELLTGHLPFESEDAMELVHYHLARNPTPPYLLNAAIPKSLSDIVLKLMAKTAEERYQSAWGVEQDLITCQWLLTKTGVISDFQLAQHDFSDHLHLPQKLYGREAELQQLLETFETVVRGQSQLLLVAGYSGIGKSVLVQELYKPITERQGYFISGKFDQFQRNIPYSAVLQAFRDLVRQLLTETQEALEYWKELILRAVGNNGQIIIDVIPEVELIIGAQPEVPALSPTEAQNRFNLVFQKFIKVFCQATHPLVIFLDDLQWIDSASLKLMSLMMSDIPYFLLIGAYRDNEVSPVHPLMVALEEIENRGIQVHTSILSPLSLPHINQLISDTLHLPLACTLPLAKLVLEKTGGNPFFIGEFLKTLYVEGLLEFNMNRREWQWDLVHIKSRNITDNIVELMTNKIQRLAESTQKALIFAAAIGNQFDLKTLAIVSQQSAEWMQSLLWETLVEGLVVPLGEKHKFVHDRVQQAAYALIPEADRPQLHWQIGQLLLKELHHSQDRLFEIVDHLNLGASLLTTSAMRTEVAQLNLVAGKQAKTSAAFDAAFKYFSVGLELLDETAWENHYELVLELHTLTAEAASLTGQFDILDTLFATTTAHAKTALDMAGVYESKIHSYVAQGKLQEAIDTALEILERLGLHLVSYPTDADFQKILQQLQQNYDNAAIESLLDLPVMTNKIQLAIMRIASKATAAAYHGRPALCLTMILEQVNLSVCYGNTSESAYMYAGYALVLCGVINDIESGYRFGQLAAALLEKTGDLKFKSKTLEVVNGHVWHFKQPLQNTLSNLKIGYQSGLETGDLEYAGYNAFFYSCNGYFAGQELTTLEKEMAAYHHEMQRIHAETGLRWQAPFWQSVLNLLGDTAEPSCLKGKGFDPEQMLPILEHTNNHSALAAYYINALILNYVFGNYSQALQCSIQTERYKSGMFAMISAAVHIFYDSLTRLQLYPEATATEQAELLQHVTENQQKMQQLAQRAPMNFQHKYDLVAAEVARVMGQDWQATQLYEQAIAGAKKHDYIQEEALSYELAARFYLSHQMEKIANTYLTEAYQQYQHWGAAAKLQHLEKTYVHWLSPTQRATGINTAATIAVTSLSPRVHTTRFAAHTGWMDLSSVMKAAQALSDEMVLENLLTQMMHTVIENAGAQRGVLILEQQEQWLVQAEATVQPEKVSVLQALPVKGYVPISLLNYIIRTKQSTVFAELQKETLYKDDEYVRTHQVKSVLCLSLLHQQKLVGVIYLENNLTSDAFTPDRAQVLTLLSSQMAISLDNARFVRELEQARQAAEAANQAKTAFLSNVSHELRTPLNGILGYAQLLQQDSNLNEEQKEFINTIYRSGEHLLVMVSDILDISKLQTAQLELHPSDLYLPHLLSDLVGWFQDQAREKGLTFRYEADPQLPSGIVVDAKRLRQILHHLLSNAVKFTQQGSIIFQVCLLPETTPERHQLQFIITDTGMGVLETTLAKLFTPFEQAGDWLHKSAGAGLGLSLAKQLVELMGGKITVQSQVGEGSTFIVQLECAKSQEWQMIGTTSEVNNESVVEVEDDLPIKGPSVEKARELLHLAMMGDFFGLLELVTALEQEDEELHPFVEKIRQWARNFQDDPIEKLARQFADSV